MYSVRDTTVKSVNPCYARTLLNGVRIGFVWPSRRGVLRSQVRNNAATMTQNGRNRTVYRCCWCAGFARGRSDERLSIGAMILSRNARAQKLLREIFSDEKPVLNVSNRGTKTPFVVSVVYSSRVARQSISSRTDIGVELHRWVNEP